MNIKTNKHMSIFKDYASVSDASKKFTLMVNGLREALKDDFVEYDTYYGYKTNDFSEMLSECLPNDIYEDKDENLYVIYEVEPSSVKYIMNWLANWDMVCVKNGTCSIKYSNHADVAKMLNRMKKFAEQSRMA